MAGAGSSRGNVVPGRLVGMDVRVIRESDIDEFRAVMGHSFGFDPKPEDLESFKKLFELDRLFAAFDGDELVGTGGAFSFDMTVPGGLIPCGGTTVITVKPTHRRQGVLTAMMEFHLSEASARGELATALWATESAIYGRFGYGIAAHAYEMKVERASISFAHLAAAQGLVRLVDVEEARKILPDIYERVRPERPGFLTRSPVRWDEEHFYDPEHHRSGRTAKRWVVYEDSSGVGGYANYRQQLRFEDGLPSGTVEFGELIATSPEAEDALWRYLVGIDLVRELESWNTDPSASLRWIVADGRRVHTRPSDGVWVRLLDIPGALEARQYRVPGQLVMEVSDGFGDSAGRYSLDAGPSQAASARTNEPSDLALDVRELGAIYLGGTRPSELARAGLITGSDEAVRMADDMFGWHIEPWCPELF